MPLFQVDGNGVHVSEPFLLGQPGGRIRLATTVTVGTEVLEAIGLDLEVPTQPVRRRPVVRADADRDPAAGGTGGA